MKRERISAIVLDYLGAEKTEKCLMSLVGQGIKTAYVMDNSGLNSSWAELRKAVDRVLLTGADYQIQILSAGRNLGFANGVNFVISHDKHSQSPHDYYLLLNNDALAGPGLVNGLIAALKEDPGAALVAPRVISSDPKREYGIWYHRYLGLLLSRSGRFRFHYFTGCCLLIPKDMVVNSNLFSEAFFMYGDDAELGWRLTRQGQKMICASNVFVQHDLGPSADRTSFFYEYHMVRSHLILSLRTWLHPIEIPVLVIAKYSALACRAVIRCLRYRTLVPLAALFLSWIPLRVDKP